VTLETLLMGDLSGRRYFKPLFGAGIRFYLGHFQMLLHYTFEAFPTTGTLCGPLQAIVSLNEGRKDKGSELSSKSNFQKYSTPGSTAFSVQSYLANLCSG
jgi:hypothetical protein